MMRVVQRVALTGTFRIIRVLACFLTAGLASAATVDAVWNSAADVPVTANGYTATGNTVDFTLNYAPETGADLMVVKNTGLPFISGTFDNLAQGQAVALDYGGVTYRFVANYYGGSGNDLVLVWASNRAFAWGWNQYGQLGNNSTWDSNLAGPMTATGVLAGKTLVALAAGYYHSLMLCADGTVATSGSNLAGQSLTPVAVSAAPGVSALHGKVVVAIAAGAAHSLALCLDGTVASWGLNSGGQLGDNTTINRQAPVAVSTEASSALYGKTVVAIAAGSYHSLALCSDGTVAAWGVNGYGRLGDNTSINRSLPVAVNAETDSALHGRTVIAIAAGFYHSLALCSDGTVLAWGGNSDGQLGDNTTTNRLLPVAVSTAAEVSVLYNKAVVAIAAGWGHSLTLCSDSTVAAWGNNTYGQLGDNTITRRMVPVAVNTNAGVSAIYGREVIHIAAGLEHSLAFCSNRLLAAWGRNYSGQLGDNSYAGSRPTPVSVNSSPLSTGQRFCRVFAGPQAYHTLALVAAPPASEIILVNADQTTSGAFRFTFTNIPGAFFGVVAATNPALPLSNWTSLTGLTEVSPGQFEFTDPQASNSPRRFYRVRSP